jgi:hypothetical protein
VTEEDFPRAWKIVVTTGDLDARTAASPRGRFPPEEAWRTKGKAELRRVSKRGCRLNMAELELGVPNHRWLSRRTPAIERTREEAAAWESPRNQPAFYRRRPRQTQTAPPAV